ncbi:MAG: CDP-diacylglycerol--serine O-phosphatidyltransferase [Hyphomicrobiales bacterium]
MRKIIQQVPNLITSGNLLCGCFSIVAGFSGHLGFASLFILLGAFFDFFDGFAARLLNAKSEMGLQMDSLADMITFGLAPSVILYQLIADSGLDFLNINGVSIIAYLGFLHAVFAAFRLAKFNIDTRQTESFLGLPSPASALIILSFPLILHYQEIEFIWIKNLISNPWFLLFIVFFNGILMVSELPLFSLKFKAKDPKNKLRIAFLIISIVLLVLLKFIAIPIIIIIYIITSLFTRRTFK